MSVTPEHHTNIDTLPDVITLQNPPTACKGEQIILFKILTFSFRIIYIQNMASGAKFTSFKAIHRAITTPILILRAWQQLDKGGRDKYFNVFLTNDIQCTCVNMSILCILLLYIAHYYKVHVF